MLPDDADFTLHTNKSVLQFSDHTFYQYLNLLLAHLDARMLRDYIILGVYEALVVKTDGGAKDKRKMKVLGDHGRRALHMCLDVHIKSEREDSGSSAKRPADDGNADSSAAILQRFLGLRAADAGQDSISEATSVSELQGRLHAVFPATADGIGQYEGIGNPTAQPQQMASATVWASKRASVCTRIAAVDAEMARCDSAEDR